MSLAIWQSLWIQLFMDPHLRERWQTDYLPIHDLQPEEVRCLGQISPEMLQEYAAHNLQTRQQLFRHFLPVNLQHLLPHDLIQSLITGYISLYPDATLYPKAQAMPRLLAFIFQDLRQRRVHIPHLEDIIRYELLASQLQLFQLPQPLAWCPGPRLATWAGLLEGGPHLIPVLESLLLNPPELSQIPDQPKCGYLLTRTLSGLRAEALPAALYQCLSQCDGQSSWSDGVSACLLPPEQHEAMLAWENVLHERGILIYSTAPRHP
jgi:hypothetical protein